MRSASKRTMYVLSAGLWFAASIFAVSLVYDLDRPLHAAGMGGLPLPPSAAAAIALGWLMFASAVLGWGRGALGGPRESRLICARARHP
jgi:hypothetical protein